MSQFKISAIRAMTSKSLKMTRLLQVALVLISSSLSVAQTTPQIDVGEITPSVSPTELSSDDEIAEFVSDFPTTGWTEPPAAALIPVEPTDDFVVVPLPTMPVAAPVAPEINEEPTPLTDPPVAAQITVEPSAGFVVVPPPVEAPVDPEINDEPTPLTDPPVEDVDVVDPGASEGTSGGKGGKAKTKSGKGGKAKAKTKKGSKAKSSKEANSKKSSKSSTTVRSVDDTDSSFQSETIYTAITNAMQVSVGARSEVKGALALGLAFAVVYLL